MKEEKEFHIQRFYGDLLVSCPKCDATGDLGFDDNDDYIECDCCDGQAMVNLSVKSIEEKEITK